MFKLNEAVAHWRRELHAGGIRRRDTLDELEIHLREEIDRQMATGRSEEEAFRQAAARLGDPLAMGKEFRKARGVFGGLLALAGGNNMDLNQHPGLRNRLLAMAWLILAVSFIMGGMVGWQIIQSWSRTGDDPYPSSTGLTFLFKAGIWSLLLTAISLTLLLWWTKRGERRKRLPLLLPPLLVLTPVYLVIGLGLAGTVPFWVIDIVTPDKVVQSALSPDGRWEVYVVDKPCLDGPDHRLCLRPAGARRGREVGRLGSDCDSIVKIHWSPDSRFAVYESRLMLHALHPADGKIMPVSLGAVECWRNGTFALGMRDVRQVTGIEFTKPDTLIYFYKVNDTPGQETVEVK